MNGPHPRQTMRGARRNAPLALPIDRAAIDGIGGDGADLLAVVDGRGRILEIDERGRLLLGYLSEQVSRLSLFEIVPDLNAEQLAGFRRRAERREPVAVERRLRCKDGAIVPIELSMAVVKVGFVEALLVAATDITEIKRSEERRLGTLTASEGYSRLKSAFALNTSLEIRAPLKAIAGYVSRVADLACDAGDERGLDALEGIERATRRLLSTIQSTIDLSSIQNRRFYLRTEEIDLADHVDAAVEPFREDAERRGVAIVWDPRRFRPRIRFDGYCLFQAVAKLLDNAIKFSGGGTVTVELGRDAGGEITLQVRDTGIGISDGYLDLLFQPFSQVESGAARRFESMGIGLVLARRLVEMNGASLSAASEPGVGSTFRIHFPIELATTAIGPSWSHAPATAGPNSHGAGSDRDSDV